MSIQKEQSCFYKTVSLTNTFHVAVGLFSNISQWHQNVVRTKKWHTRGQLSVSHSLLTTFWRHLWSITEQTQGNMESICFIQQRNKLLQLFYLKLESRPLPTSANTKKAIWKAWMILWILLELKEYAWKTRCCSQHWTPFDLNFEWKERLVTVEICVLCGWWFSNQFDNISETPYSCRGVGRELWINRRICLLKISVLPMNSLV